MRDSSYKRLVYVILIVAVIMRFGFLLSLKVLPVMWDARLYASAALGLISYVDTPHDEVSDSEEEGRAQFLAYHDEYINGEQIEWLSYKPPTLSEARELIFLGGPLYPATLAIVFSLAPVEDFTVARILGILMDLFSTILVIGIGYRLIGRSAALVAGALYAVYFPFTLTSTMLLLETSTAFYTLLSVYLLLRAVEDDHRKQYIFAGIVAGLLILNKPTAALLFIPLGFGLFLYGWKQRPTPTVVNRVLLFTAPALIFFVGWISVTSAQYGQLTLSDPEYSSANLKSSSSVKWEGYDLDRVEDDFQSRTLWGEVSGDPVGFIVLLAKKFDRLWTQPYNDFRRSIFLPAKFFDWLHIVVVVSGMIGLLVLMLQAPRSVIWPWMVILYYTAVHLVFHSVSRYNFVAMPFLIFGAAWLIWEIGWRFTQGRSRPKYRIVLALILLVAAWLIDHGWVNASLGAGLSAALVLVSIAVRFILLATGVWILLCAIELKSKTGRFLVTLAVVLFTVVPLATSTFARDAWSEFRCTIEDPGVKAGTRIYISVPPTVAADELLAAVIDMNSGPRRKNTFSVWLNSDSTEFVQAQQPLRSLFYPKPTYRFYSLLIPIEIEQFRQYVHIPLDANRIISSIDSLGYVDLAVAINARFAEENNFVSIYGAFPTSDSAAYIPSMRFTSIERFVERRDPRIRYWVEFFSDSAKSYYIPRDAGQYPENRDLSPSPGYQYGRYNMYLIHYKPDGSFDVY